MISGSISGGTLGQNKYDKSYDDKNYHQTNELKVKKGNAGGKWVPLKKNSVYDDYSLAKPKSKQ